MNCSSSEALFERFLDGELSARERARMLAHVDGCANCRGVLEELRVVDALLLEPRAVRLAPNFTFATMAEVRALRAPHAPRRPVAAFVVSYIVAAWLLVAAAFVLAPQTMHALGATAAGLATSVADAFGGLGHDVARAFGRGALTVAQAVSALVILDVALSLALGAAVAFVRPRLAERMRS